MRAENQCHLVEQLKRHPGSTAKQLAPYLDWKLGTTRACLTELNDYGIVRREKVPSENQRNGARVEYRYWFVPRIAAPPVADTQTYRELENAR